MALPDGLDSIQLGQLPPGLGINSEKQYKIKHATLTAVFFLLLAILFLIILVVL